MLSALWSFDKEVDRPLDAINLSALFTKLPRTLGTKETKLLVASEVAADVDRQIELGFLHPTSGIVTAQGLNNVAWGHIQLGLADEGRCR